jgi:hypothetical protein
VSTINQVYEFGASADPSNILSNAAYSADAGRLAGHEPGIARQELENAVLRNLSRFNHGLAEFIATHYAPGVVDDGDAAKIVSGMQAAVAAIEFRGAWSNAVDYTVPAMVFGSNGKLYLALLASGPGGAGAKDPTSQPTYWLDYAASIAPTGPTVDELYIDAGAMTPTITGGAALAVVEDATNHLTRNVMSFQGATADTKAAANFRLPSNWDRGTVKAKVLWTPAAGASAADNVRFALAGVAVSDDDALDVALGAAVTIDDAVIAVGDLHVSPASAALTIGGTPQVGDYVRLVLTRDYDYGASPMSEAAQVLGIVLQYGITGNIAAW